MPRVPAAVAPTAVGPQEAVLHDGVMAARERVKEPVEVPKAGFQGAGGAPLELRVDLPLVPPNEGFQAVPVQLARLPRGGAAVGGLVLELCVCGRFGGMVSSETARRTEGWQSSSKCSQSQSLHPNPP